MRIDLLLVLNSFLLVTSLGYEELVGKGTWLLLSILECENADQYELRFSMNRKKINRTHDGFEMKIDFDREINSTYGAELVAKKEVDGGFKYHTTLSYDNICAMGVEYAGENWPLFLSSAKIDPPDCPIPPGNFHVENFVIDYTQLKEDGVYGTFDVEAYLVFAGQRLGCFRWLVNFEKKRENDDDDDCD